MRSSTSLVRRVAWGSALAASAAALLAALATIVLATYLLRGAEDRRLEDAAITFATELNHSTGDRDSLQRVHRAESEEMEHTGMRFAVYAGTGELLAGPRRYELPIANGCSSVQAGLRACRVQTRRGQTAVAYAAQTTFVPLLASAAIASALLAALLGWLASRPISRFVIGPLTRLRERIAKLDVNAAAKTDLGSSEHVVEVDALRSTIAQLILRVEHAITQAQRFAANAAHELRTPLTAVQAELELLSESVTEPEPRKDALRAHARLAELLVLVERLLVLSMPTRIATDAHELVSLRDLLEDTVAAMPTVERQRVSLSTNDALVHGDATLLGTMVANALSNALKFGEAANIELHVIGPEAVLHIDDNGPGMELVDRERVFEPFFRAEHALRNRLPGHGLGLALIRHIAQTHGGFATFVDKRGAGSRLEIRLPTRASQLDRKPA